MKTTIADGGVDRPADLVERPATPVARSGQVHLSRATTVEVVADCRSVGRRGGVVACSLLGFHQHCWVCRVWGWPASPSKQVAQERAAALQSDQPLFVPLEGLEHHYQPSR